MGWHKKRRRSQRLACPVFVASVFISLYPLVDDRVQLNQKSSYYLGLCITIGMTVFPCVSLL
jgi:hypothetical protein